MFAFAGRADLKIGVSLARSIRRMSTPTTRKIINTKNAPQPAGAYSQAVQVNNTLYCAGQIGRSPSGEDMSPDVAEQTRQTLKNLGEVLKAAGSDYDKVVKTSIFLADVKDWPGVNVVYSEFFRERLPARAAFQAGALPMGAKVEIEAIAIVGDIVEQ